MTQSARPRLSKPFYQSSFRSFLLVIAWCAACTMLVSSPLHAADEPDALAKGLELLTPEKLRMHLEVIASDELQGRATPSPGLDIASRYLAAHLAFYGLKPAGDDNTYFQKIKMARIKTGKDSHVRVRARGLQADFNIGVDFVGTGYDLDAKLVFAGYGLSAPEKGYDDYAGLDVKDKVALIVEGFPEGHEPGVFEIERTVGDRTRRFPPNRYRTAVEKGAAGVLYVRGDDFVQAASQRSGNGTTSSRFDQAVARLDQDRTVFVFREAAAALNVSLVPEAARRLERLLDVQFRSAAAEAGKTGTMPPLADATVEIRFTRQELQTMWPRNVVALREGTDEQLKEQFVVISAHYDHIGVGSRGGDDQINNGADDDGSGTVTILNLAEAFSKMPAPRRSVLFFWTCGEERGLIGSDYYVQHPVVPLDKTVAVLNVDMIGRYYQDKEENADHLFVIGTTETSKEFDELVGSVNAQSVGLRLDRNDPANLFRRSDHYNFAKNAIPVVFFTTGLHKDYHRPSDEVQHIRFDKMHKVAQLILRCGWEVANRDEVLKLNDPKP